MLKILLAMETKPQNRKYQIMRAGGFGQLQSPEEYCILDYLYYRDWFGNNDEEIHLFRQSGDMTWGSGVTCWANWSVRALPHQRDSS